MGGFEIYPEKTHTYVHKVGTRERIYDLPTESLLTNGLDR